MKIFRFFFIVLLVMVWKEIKIVAVKLAFFNVLM